MRDRPPLKGFLPGRNRCAGQSGVVANRIENARQRAHHLIVGEPEDRPSESFNGLLAVIVVDLLPVFVVNLAIEFNDELEGHTGKIDEVAIDRVLAAEAKAVETAGAEMLPEGRLRAGLALAQVAGARGLSLGRHEA